MAIRAVETKDIVVLKKIATKILEPIYGDQTKAINEWLTGAGSKHAFVSIHDDGKSLAGLLSLKANLNLTYLKISTLVVLPEYEKNGHGKEMIQWAEVFAKKYGYQRIIVTVSEVVEKSIKFFQKHGFDIVSEERGKYKKDVSEFIMQKEFFIKDFRFKRKYFLMVQGGNKTLEARVDYPFIKKVKIGEIIQFFWEENSIRVIITAVRKYKNFKHMLDNEDVDQLTPGIKRVDALKEYEKIYPEWKIKKYGGVRVFAFKII